MKIKNFALVLLAIVIPAAALLPLPDFWIVQLNYIGLYALVCLGLVLLTGVAGLTSFGQAAFVGIGAYTTAWLTLNTGMSPWLTLFVGLAITAASALIVGWPSPCACPATTCPWPPLPGDCRCTT
jgi:branched-chain amino acid transport system permease protein